MTLRDLRKQKKLTQEQIAKLLGIKQENVSRLERRNCTYTAIALVNLIAFISHNF